jgi:inorganic triphosphatase YgiF
MGRELELKLGVAPAELPLLRRRLARLGSARIEQLHAIYFDTRDGLLARAGMGLRLRNESGRWVQCLKTAGEGALSRRGEWEVSARLRAGRPRLDPDAFGDTPLAAVLAEHPRAQLVPWLEVRVRREAHEIEFAGAHIEVALDIGTLAAGGREAAVRELELEARRGPAHALLTLALELAAPGGRARSLALLPLTESKAQRGARLLHDAPRASMPAGAAQLRRGVRRQDAADASLRGVAGRAAQILAANLQATLASEDPETVHQARVALRRLRAAVRLLDGQSSFPEALSDELRWLGAQLGRVRDAEVLAGRCARAWDGTAAAGGRPALPSPPVQVAAATQARLAARARAARQRLRVALASARTAKLLLGLMAWSEAPPNGKARTGRVAARRLERLRERLARAAADWAHADDADRHRVRILVKRLRYGIELLLPERKASDWLLALRGLQEDLGELNDAALAREQLRRLCVPPALIDRAAPAPDAARLVAQAGRALERLPRLSPPWN